MNQGTLDVIAPPETPSTVKAIPAQSLVELMEMGSGAFFGSPEPRY